MPQPRSGGTRSTGSRSTSRAKSASSGAGTKKAAGGASAASKKATGTASTASKRATTARASSAKKTAVPAVDERLEAAAARVRKLNERIIDAGKHAGEDALNAYEKALKSIASGIERGPGKSDIEWFSNLATAQAKFIRDVTEAWTNAARDMLKK
jgi:hypothetical protein